MIKKILISFIMISFIPSINSIYLANKMKNYEADMGYTTHRFYGIPNHPAVPLDMESFLANKQRNLFIRVHNNQNCRREFRFNLDKLIKEHFGTSNNTKIKILEIHYGYDPAGTFRGKQVYLTYCDPHHPQVEHLLYSEQEV